MNILKVETKILNLITSEKTNAEIANETGYSVKTIEKKIKNLFRKYGVKSKVGLAREFTKQILSP